MFYSDKKDEIRIKEHSNSLKLLDKIFIGFIFVKTLFQRLYIAVHVPRFVLFHHTIFVYIFFLYSVLEQED